MNASVYIFGKLLSGYTQYPNDDKRAVFEKIADSIYTKSLISVRRYDDILYYIYTRSIKSSNGDSQYIGLVQGFNGIYCDDILSLFAIFDDALTKIVLTGKILGFNNEGEIIAKVEELYHKDGEIERITNSLYSAVNGLSATSFKKLPPINYSIGIDEAARLTDSSTPLDFANALKVYNIINIYKNSDSEPLALSEYSARLKELGDRIKTLSKDNSTLRADIAKVRRQKKRTTAVTLLSIVIAVILIVSMRIEANLSEQVRTLNWKRGELEELNDNQEKLIESHSNTIKAYSEKNEDLKKKLLSIRTELSGVNSEKVQLQTDNSALQSQVYSLKSQVADLKSQLENQSSPSTSHSSQGNAEMSLSSEYITLNVGSTTYISAYNYGTSLSWESENPQVATISSSGAIKGISAGRTTIWAKGKNYTEYKRCVVTVVSPTSPSSVRTVYTKNIYMRVGETIKAYIDDGYVSRWEIAKNKSAYVCAYNDELKALKAGNITVWGYVGNSPKLFTVTVK